ncbi:hypothetical protein [Marinicella sp. W31]|uniref:hypothetical protein n=1 Tax=Marinicella sp. W31 TaxID=3023713 RepID=UPI003757A145
MYKILALFTVISGAYAEVDFDNYIQSNKELIQAAQQGVAYDELSTAAKALVAASKPILNAYINKHKQCKDYLSKVLEDSGLMLSLDAETIERDYHDDGALPDAEFTCYHAKDLLVHPATVVVLTASHPDNKETRNQIIHELEEVAAHAIVAEKLLK